MTSGRVLQLNISPGGLPKTPIDEGFVTPLGLRGDDHSHPGIHGGPRKAILLIAREVVDELAEAGYPVFYGALGENITTEGIDHRTWRAGQRFRIGNDVVIELTQPRGPCKALDRYGKGLAQRVYDAAVKAGDPASPVWGRSGFYASVVQTGPVLPGAPIVFLDQMV